MLIMAFNRNDHVIAKPLTIIAGEISTFYLQKRLVPHAIKDSLLSNLVVPQYFDTIQFKVKQGHTLFHDLNCGLQPRRNHCILTLVVCKL